MRRTLAFVALAPCCVAAACSSSASSGPSAGSLQDKSAQQVLALGEAAINQANDSFHFIDQTRAGSQVVTLVGDATTAGAHQLLTGTSTSTLEVIRSFDGGLYVRGGSAALQAALGLPSGVAAAHAGAWIQLQPGDAPYTAVAVSLDPQKEINAYLPAPPLTLEAPRQLHGRTVIGVSGSSSQTSGVGQINSVTLFIPTQPPYTPAGGTLTFSGNGSTASGAEAAVFSNWGKQVRVAAPVGAVPYASLAG